MNKTRYDSSKSPTFYSHPSKRAVEVNITIPDSKSKQPSNDEVCEQAWEVQKLRIQQSEQGYFQIRTSASVVASFATGGAVASIGALLSIFKDTKVSGVLWINLLLVAISLVSIALLAVGSYKALSGTFASSVKDLVVPDHLIDNRKYKRKSELFRQQIANARPFISSHRERTTAIAKDVRDGVQLLVACMVLAFSTSFIVVSIEKGISSTKEKSSPQPESPNSTESRPKIIPAQDTMKSRT